MQADQAAAEPTLEVLHCQCLSISCTTALGVDLGQCSVDECVAVRQGCEQHPCAFNKFSVQGGLALPAALLADGAHAMPNTCFTLVTRVLGSACSACLCCQAYKGVAADIVTRTFTNETPLRRWERPGLDGDLNEIS